MFVDPYVHQHNTRTERLFSRMDQQIEDWRRRFPEGDSLRNNFKVGSPSLGGAASGSRAPDVENTPPTPSNQPQSPVMMQSSRILKTLTELSDSHNNLSDDHKALKQQYDASQKELRSLGAVCRSQEAKSQAAFLQLEERCQSLVDANATLEKRLDVMERLFCNKDTTTTGGASSLGFASPSSRGSNPSGHEPQFAEMTALLRELVASNNSHQRLFTPSSVSPDIMTDRQVLLESKVSILETQLRDERAHHRLAVERAISDAVEQATLNLRREMAQTNNYNTSSRVPYGGGGSESTPMADHHTTPLSLNTPPSWGRYNTTTHKLKESSKKTDQSMKAFDREEREINERRRQREREELEAIETAAEERRRQMEELRSRKNEERRAMMAQHDEVLRRQDEKRLEQAAEIQRRFEEAQRSYETTLHNARIRKESEREALIKDHRDATRDAKKDSIHSEIQHPRSLNNSSATTTTIAGSAYQNQKTGGDSYNKAPVANTGRDEAAYVADKQYTPLLDKHENEAKSTPQHAYHHFGSTITAAAASGAAVEKKPEVLKEVPVSDSMPTAALYHSDRQNSPPPTDPIQTRPAATTASGPTTNTMMMPSDDESEHTKSESLTQKEDAPQTHRYSASSRTSDTRSERAPIARSTAEETSAPQKVLPKTMTAFRSDSSRTETDGRDQNTHSAKSLSQSSSSSSEEPAGYQLPRNRGGGGISISPPGGRGGSRTTGIPQSGLGGGRTTAPLPSLFGGILGSGSSAPAPVSSRLSGAMASSTAPQPNRQPLKAKPLSALLKANHDSSDDSSNF